MNMKSTQTCTGNVCLRTFTNGRRQVFFDSLCTFADVHRPDRFTRRIIINILVYYFVFVLVQNRIIFEPNYLSVQIVRRLVYNSSHQYISPQQLQLVTHIVITTTRLGSVVVYVLHHFLQVTHTPL